MRILFYLLLLMLCLVGCSGNNIDTIGTTAQYLEDFSASTAPEASLTTFEKIDFEEVEKSPWEAPYTCDPVPIDVALSIPTKEVAVAVADGIYSGLQINPRFAAYTVFYVTSTESWIVGYTEPPLKPSDAVFIELSAKTGEVIRIFWG